MTFAVGSYGTDSASRLDYGQVAAKGGRFAVRYSAGAATAPVNPSHGKNASKLLQPGELADILAHGLDFIANDEWYETRIGEGAAAAEQDAPATLQFWRDAGLHPGSTIQLNWDTASTSNAGTLANIAAYFARTNQIWGGEYVADGFYAGVPMLNWAAENCGVIHGWIPEGASFSVAKQSLASLGIPLGAPAYTNWDLWAPLPDQVAEATKYLNSLCDGKLQSVIWQDLNHWFGGAADENIALRGASYGSHLGAGGGAVPIPPPAPVPVPPAQKYGQGSAVPALIAHGTHQYFGSISGPNASHGGFVESERPLVQLLQRRLIACGFVPGVSNPMSGWADGIFDTPHDHPGTGETSAAVTRFQHAYMPGTDFYGQVWSDDWAKLFSL